MVRSANWEICQMTDTAVRSDETSRAHPAHPLDPASTAEYLAGREIMAAAGLLAEPVRFAYYGLEEPPKGASQPDRRLRAFLLDLLSGEANDVVVAPPEPRGGGARTLDPRTAGEPPV